MHFAVVLLTMLILPVGCVLAQLNGHPNLLPLIGRWFVFWAAGARLLIAGFRQVAAPRLTLEGIFGLVEPRAWPLVQELGFWNIGIGLLCLATLAEPIWLVPLALASGLFYGMAGLKHLAAKQKSFEANTALISDLAVSVVLLVYAGLSLLSPI